MDRLEEAFAALGVAVVVVMLGVVDFTILEATFAVVVVDFAAVEAIAVDVAVVTTMIVPVAAAVVTDVETVAVESVVAEVEFTVESGIADS